MYRQLNGGIKDRNQASVDVDVGTLYNGMRPCSFARLRDCTFDVQPCLCARP